MKDFYLFLAFISLSIFSNAQTVDNFQLNTPDGQVKHYADLKGSKVTVLDFWATWCKPCVNSIPKLVKLSGEYSKDSVKFIGISLDSPRNLSKIKPFAESIGITYPVLIDLNQDVSRDLNVTVVPTILIIGPHDEVRYIHEGYAPGEESDIKNEINSLLNE